MPVAQKHSTIFEESHLSAMVALDGDQLLPTQIEETLFDEVIELIDQLAKYEREEKDNKEKVQKLKEHIKEAKEVVSKAEDKKEILIKRNQAFHQNRDKKMEKIRDALEYWTEQQGINVVELSTETDNFKLYRFMLSKLPLDINNDNPQQIYNIDLKYQENELKIVGQQPELLSQEQINEFNEELSKTCVNLHEKNKSNIVDYKLAIIKIKKAVLRNLSTTPVAETPIVNDIKANEVEPSST